MLEGGYSRWWTTQYYIICQNWRGSTFAAPVDGAKKSSSLLGKSVDLAGL